jgi:hypothetical protein
MDAIIGRALVNALEKQPNRSELREMEAGPGRGGMFVANHGGKAYVRRASQHLGSDVRTARMVTHEFCKQFFASVRIDEARLDRHLWHG